MWCSGGQSIWKLQTLPWSKARSVQSIQASRLAFILRRSWKFLDAPRSLAGSPVFVSVLCVVASPASKFTWRVKYRSLSNFGDLSRFHPDWLSLFCVECLKTHQSDLAGIQLNCPKCSGSTKHLRSWSFSCTDACDKHPCLLFSFQLLKSIYFANEVLVIALPIINVISNSDQKQTSSIIFRSSHE